MKFNPLTTLLAAVAVMLLVLPATSSAAPPPDEGARGERARGDKARFFEHVKAKRSKMLRKGAGLDEATAQQVEAVLGQFDTTRKKLHLRKRAARRALRALFEADSTDQAAFGAALDEMQGVYEAMGQLRSKQATALRRVLQPKQAARLFVALHKMKRRMRRGPGKRWRGDKGKRWRGDKGKRRRGERRHRRGQGGDWEADPDGYRGPDIAPEDDLDGAPL